MDTVQLTSNETTAVVLRDGAWLLQLADKHGDILFPKQWMETSSGKRARGGSHVCLPNFGPGGNSGLPQHGFGRISSWKVVEQGVSRVTLELSGGERRYASLQSRITYALKENSLTMTLKLTNSGLESLHVAPGFHPYFALALGEEQVMVDDESYSLSELSGTIFLQGETKQLSTKLRTLSLSATNLSTWALWTDNLGRYVCLEPTFAGNSFADDNPEEEELLRAGLSKSYELQVKWQLPL